jgi:hypothetical protein
VAHEKNLDVLISLCPEGDKVDVRILAEHGNSEPASVSMELDPGTLLLRWR